MPHPPSGRAAARYAIPPPVVQSTQPAHPPTHPHPTLPTTAPQMNCPLPETTSFWLRHLRPTRPCGGQAWQRHRGWGRVHAALLTRVLHSLCPIAPRSRPGHACEPAYPACTPHPLADTHPPAGGVRAPLAPTHLLVMQEPQFYSHTPLLVALAPTHLLVAREVGDGKLAVQLGVVPPCQPHLPAVRHVIRLGADEPVGRGVQRVDGMGRCVGN